MLLSNLKRNKLEYSIEEIEDKFGTIPSLDKVAWIKANIASIILNIYAFGSCPNGNNLNLAPFTISTNAYATPINSKNSVSSLLTCTLNIANSIAMFYIL